MKETIRQFRLWRIRRKITKAIRRIQQAQLLHGGDYENLVETENMLRRARKAHNP